MVAAAADGGSTSHAAVRTALRACAALLVTTGAVHAADPKPDEEAEIVRLIAAACPGKRATAQRASEDFHSRDRRAAALPAYAALADGCAKSVAVVHARVAVLKVDAGDLAGAEVNARRAAALEPNVSNKLSLLQVLVRTEKPDADALYAELKRYDGAREDIWTGLAYVAFHRDDVAFMKVASHKAMALDTRRWQAWFVAAVAEGLQASPDYPGALKWLDHADELGAPARYTSGMRESLKSAAASRGVRAPAAQP